MASLQECEAALQALAARFAAVDVDLRRRHAADRTVSCRVPDLGVAFSVRVTVGSVDDVSCRPDHDPAEPSQMRLAAASDDLVSARLRSPRTAGCVGHRTAHGRGERPRPAAAARLL